MRFRYLGGITVTVIVQKLSVFPVSPFIVHFISVVVVKFLIFASAMLLKTFVVSFIRFPLGNWNLLEVRKKGE